MEELGKMWQSIKPKMQQVLIAIPENDLRARTRKEPAVFRRNRKKDIVDITEEMES